MTDVVHVHPVLAQIRDACLARRWSARRLARQAGVHENTVQRLLHGGSASMRTLDAVLAALGMYLLAVPYPERAWPPPLYPTEPEHPATPENGAPQ